MIDRTLWDAGTDALPRRFHAMGTAAFLRGRIQSDRRERSLRRKSQGVLFVGAESAGGWHDRTNERRKRLQSVVRSFLLKASRDGAQLWNVATRAEPACCAMTGGCARGFCVNRV